MKNVCIVGYGAIGPIHAAAVSSCPDAQLYAVCDNNFERAEKCREKYGAAVYTDFNEMLKDKCIDSVHICTPHYLHAEMTEKAIKADKEVVLEKPATISSEEFDRLLSIKTDRKICVMLQNRTNKSLERLHNIVVNNTTDGKILGICGFLTWQRTPEYYASDEWRGKWATEGGGLLINQAVHTLDIISWLGGGASSIKGSISTKKLADCIEVEDTADALIYLNNGVSGMFYGTNCYSSNSPMRIEVSYEKALYRYADERLYKITESSAEVIADDKNNSTGRRYWGSGHSNVINNFYSSLSGKGGSFTTLEDAENAMRLLFAFYESARHNGIEIKLSNCKTVVLQLNHHR